MTQRKRRPAKRATTTRPGARPRRREDSGPRRSDLQSDETRKLQGPLGGALGRLQPVQREVLQLRMGLVDGHPHTINEVAEALGISLADAKDIETRAMAHLRDVVPLDKLARLLES